jgi:tetratricopeptide (TPR) repeat protein
MSNLSSYALLTLLCSLLVFSCGNRQSEEPAPEVEMDYQDPRITQLSEQIVDNPDDAMAYLQRALIFREFNNAMALEDLKTAWSLDSSSSPINIELSKQYLEMGDSRAAIGVLNRHASQNPQDEPALQELSQLALVLKQYQTAITASNQLLNIDPNRADYHYLRARTYRMAGDTTASIAAYQTTLDRDPDFYRAHLELGYLLTSAGDENGVRYLHNALAIHDTSSAALLQMAKFYQDQEELGTSIDYYEQLINLQPQNSDALYNLGTVWFVVDSVSKAKSLFDLCIAVDPARPSAYYAKAICCVELGEDAEAQSALRSALNLNPELDEAQRMLDSLSLSKP